MNLARFLVAINRFQTEKNGMKLDDGSTRFLLAVGLFSGEVFCYHGNLRVPPPLCHVYPQEIAGPNKALLRETNG